MKHFSLLHFGPAAPGTRLPTPSAPRLTVPVRRALLVFWMALGFTGPGSSARGQYVVDFEAETKTPYASTTVTLNGLNWNMTDALIGSEDLDFKHGSKSARLRGYGTSSMAMLEDKTNGLGTLRFKHRRYGADAQIEWRVEYSVNAGMSWNHLGSFTATADEATFSEELNIPGDVRIRIRTDTSGNTNRRTNIDDITLTDFVPGGGWVLGSEIQATRPFPGGGSPTLEGNLHIADRMIIRAGVVNDTRHLLIRSQITGSNRTEIWLGYARHATTGSTVVSNPDNRFAGTWRVQSSELIFSRPGSVGVAATVRMEKPGGILRIQFDWEDHAGTLNVEGGTVYLGDHHWTVGDLIIGNTYMAPGTHSIADLNSQQAGTFVGTGGRITVRP